MVAETSAKHKVPSPDADWLGEMPRVQKRTQLQAGTMSELLRKVLDGKKEEREAAEGSGEAAMRERSKEKSLSVWESGLDKRERDGDLLTQPI
jgi:hypothetical protein